MVDPLMAHLPVQVNSWKDQMVRQALAPLHGLAEETGAAVLVVAHLNKGQGTDPLHRLGGSIGIPAAARSVLLLGRSRVPRRAGARFSLTRGGLTLERLALQHRHTSNADLAIDLHQAAFNGQLHQIAKELDATFDQRRFVYEARWDPQHEWMDIGLRALQAHTVSIPRLEIDVEFDEDEALRVEISSKARAVRA
jgi:Histidine-specific methyltransferase, SAM-dependent